MDLFLVLHSQKIYPPPPQAKERDLSMIKMLSFFGFFSAIHVVSSMWLKIPRLIIQFLVCQSNYKFSGVGHRAKPSLILSLDLVKYLF
jgi:hypothetical protein